MAKQEFPIVHFYDQDFVDVYDKTWAWLADAWFSGSPANGFPTRVMGYPELPYITQFDSCLSTFFLVYSNRVHPAASQLDLFYSKQEQDGAIRWAYSVEDGTPVASTRNPKGVHPPLFPWAEFNLYHKMGNKKRIKDVMPTLEAYYNWLDATFKDETGLFAVPLVATTMENSPRDKAKYFVDFNAQMAMAALYMAELGEILNDKDISFRYKQHYFALKTRINQQMWSDELGVYVDLGKKGEQLDVRSIATYWTLLAELPNEPKAEALIAHLRNPETFGLEHPFPSLAGNEPKFTERGTGYRGSVVPPMTFMVIKGLEKYNEIEFARECAIRHLYYVVDTLHPVGKDRGALWEAYAPRKDGPAQWPGKEGFPRERYLSYIALSTITLMIENVLGLVVSLPRKTVDWVVPTLEVMGVENLSLKRNMVTILSNKSGRGWEIRLESEKLYYFTIDIVGKKKKTLPIPSGKCSMLIDKL